MNIDISKAPFDLDQNGIDWVNDTLASLTEDQKIGQLLCEILWDKPGTNLEDLFSDVQVGALMYRPFSSAKMHEYSQKIQTFSKIPMLIACNLERGGSGGNGGMTDGTYISSPMGVSATNECEMARLLGEVAASEGASVGINWTFEPIIDIDMNPENPITNVRTYGSDVDRIIAMAKGYCEGCKPYDMAVTIKHFPGDGVDYRDQHLMATVNDLSAETWFGTYGKIYKELIDYGAQTLMSAHIKQPALTRLINPDIADEDILPGSLSKELMQGIIRQRLGFNGLICTDATQMVGFTASMKRHIAIPTAIEHGADMLIFTLNQKEDIQALRNGLETGLLSKKRLDEAVTRVLALKASLKLHEKQKKGTLVSPKSAMKIIRCKEHLAWAKEIADKSITLVKNKENILPLSVTRFKKITLVEVTNETVKGHLPEVIRFKENLNKEGFMVSFFEEVPRPGATYSIDDLKKNTDLFIYYANMKVGSNQTSIRLVWPGFLGDNAPKFVQDIPTLFLSFSNPYSLVDVPMVKTYINAYASNDAIVDAMVEKLMGRSPFKGNSPVDPFAGLWDTRL